MRKFYFTIITLVALLCVTVSASATPFKAVYLELTVNETGRGKVYMKTEDPDNPQTRKSEDAVIKCVIGENGNDTLRLEVQSADTVALFQAHTQPLRPGRYFVVPYATNGVGTATGDTLWVVMP